MFSIEPFDAERYVVRTKKGGPTTMKYEYCRAVGVTKNDDGEPAYVVSFVEDGMHCLAIEDSLRML